MNPVYTSNDIKRMDRAEIEKNDNELELIQTAGNKVAEAICALNTAQSALFFCGGGNNGADGIAAAIELFRRGWRVDVYAVRKGKSDSITRLYKKYTALTGKEILPLPADAAALPKADVAVDAMLGTGARFGLGGEFLQAADIIGSMEGCTIVAVDVPTGVDADTGCCDPHAVRAHHTVCLSGFKPGVILYPGAEYAGNVQVHPVIGDPLEPQRKRYLFTDGDVLSLKRRRNTHKGTYGRLAILGGSMEMPGSALLSSEAAVRSGAGIVTLATDADTARIYAMRVREALVARVDNERDFRVLIADKTALAVGPGLGRGGRAQAYLTWAAASSLPLIIDADGLNALAASGPDVIFNRQAPTVLTPHPKELSRLLDVPMGDILTDPIAAAESAQRRYGCTVLLKGAVTVVAGKTATYLCSRGCAGMAKGGSGDVLTGVLGAFLAQGYEADYSAAAAAHLCGVAGEYAMAKYGSTAMTPYNTVEMLHRAYLPHEV